MLILRVRKKNYFSNLLHGFIAGNTLTSLFKEVQSNKQTEMFHLLVVYWNLSKHR